MLPVKYPSIDNVKVNSLRSWKGDSPGEALSHSLEQSSRERDRACVSTEENNHRWYIEEKVDGSQLSFVVSDEGQPTFYNKGSTINPTNKVFVKTINMITTLASKKIFNPTYVYHGEAVCSSRHNVVQYERYPKYYFILFDIQTSTGLLYPNEKRIEAERIGLEVVPTFIWNTDPERSPYTVCQEFLDNIVAGKVTSILGGRPEGIVLKHHNFISRGKAVGFPLPN